MSIMMETFGLLRRFLVFWVPFGVERLDEYLNTEQSSLILTSELYSYPLVMSDLQMPSMNGFEFIRKVKEINSNVNIFSDLP